MYHSSQNNQALISNTIYNRSYVSDRFKFPSRSYTSVPTFLSSFLYFRKIDLCDILSNRSRCNLLISFFLNIFRVKNSFWVISTCQKVGVNFEVLGKPAWRLLFRAPPWVLRWVKSVLNNFFNKTIKILWIIE